MPTDTRLLYHDDQTLTKVFHALTGTGLGEPTAMQAINAMQNAGILFREHAIEGEDGMVSQGYWLRTPGHDWRRVRLEDYLNAAGNAGMYAQPPIDGSWAPMPPQHFVDTITGLTGTTTDPNVGPPPPLEYADLPATLPEALNLIDHLAKQLLRLGQHLQQIADLYQPTKAGDGSRT